MTAQQAREYWTEHVRERAPLDLDNDPDALANVCHPGLPGWFNLQVARHQANAYAQMLAAVPAPGVNATALDVGCGGGRWCRMLAARGYRVTGIDLQQALIAANRQRYRDVTFVCVPLEAYAGPPVDLVSTVTVVQHHPPHVQDAMITTLRRLVRTGGHAVVLENTHDQAEHVFSHRTRAWVRKFEARGFALVARQPYDFSWGHRGRDFALRLSQAAARRLLGRPLPALRALLTRDTLMRTVATVDDRLEPWLQRIGAPAAMAVHSAFLFRAVGPAH